MTAGHCSVWKVVVVVSSLLLLASLAAGSSNPCYSHWVGPSKDNEFKCDNADEWIEYLKGKLPIAAVVLILFGCLLLLSCPFVFISRYVCQCCGGFRQRPGHCCCGGRNWDNRSEEERQEAYSKREVLIVKYATVLLCVAGVGFMVLSMVGALEFSKGINAVTDGFTNNIRWLRDIISDTKANMQRPNGSYPIDITQDLEPIDNKLLDILDQYDSSKDYRLLTKNVTYTIGFAAILPFIFILLSAVCAFCGIQSVFPTVLICVYFFLAFVYCLAGGLFFSL